MVVGLGPRHHELVRQTIETYMHGIMQRHDPMFWDDALEHLLLTWAERDGYYLTEASIQRVFDWCYGVQEQAQEADRQWARRAPDDPSAVTTAYVRSQSVTAVLADAQAGLLDAPVRDMPFVTDDALLDFDEVTHHKPTPLVIDYPASIMSPMASQEGGSSSIGLAVTQAVVGVLWEPIDWAFTVIEIGTHPDDPLSYAGLIPLVPSGVGKLLKAADNVSDVVRTAERVGIDSANPAVKWVDEVATMSDEARMYQSGAEGARSNVVTQLSQSPSIPRSDGGPVRFDGESTGFLIDRKLGVANSAKSRNQALRQSTALREAGLRGVWEVPDAIQAARAKRLLEQQNIDNIDIRIVPK